MTQKNYKPHAHSGRTGPLDPTLERAYFLASWEEKELTATVPQVTTEPSAGADWMDAFMQDSVEGEA